MELEKRPEGRPQEPPRRSDPEGCVAAVIRVPVRIVVLVLVVPVRMAWDMLVVAGRFLRDTVFRPAGRALAWLGRVLFVWPLVGIWRYAVVPLGKGAAFLGRVLLVVPAVWLYRWVLTPAGRGLYSALAWLGRYLVVVPAAWLYVWLLTPMGHALAWCGRGLAWCGRGIAWCLGMIVTGVGAVLYWTTRVLVVLPALALWRWVLTPVGRVLAVIGREVVDALGHAWRIAGYVSRAFGRFLGTLWRWTVAEPARWAYRSVLTPVGHAVRDTVLRPLADAGRAAGRATRQALAAARLTVRQTRADVRRALFGEPAKPRPADRREPSVAEARTLGSSTTALTKD
ncbi:hypothetical protein DMH12_20885 [Streptomyces sp. WAC 04229]|uniref:hypothetical protein n=1 Tax=Streptomyces sp. WAC 04229 TaxID=2203206 RepID=UPI000F74559C|nr:hypothetical protein [Streptomyces sp. WAC 04229]RSN51872.1 hypothetical protein DMH12_20885 [Streptomyces sp. WAC 04229]